MVGSYALPATFRLEWKWLKVKITLAYCTMALLMNVGSYALPATFSLEWKWLIVTNTVAYYPMTLIIAIKRFIVQQSTPSAPLPTSIRLKSKEFSLTKTLAY